MGNPITPLNQANSLTGFLPYKGKLSGETRLFSMKASIAILDGTALMVEVSTSNPTGYYTTATTTQANGQNINAILAEPIATTDSDYATAGKLKYAYEVTPTQTWYFTVGSGTFTAADVGRTCALASGGRTVAVDTNGNEFIIDGYINSTTGFGRFAMPNVQTA